MRTISIKVEETVIMHEPNEVSDGFITFTAQRNYSLNFANTFTEDVFKALLADLEGSLQRQINKYKNENQ